MPPLHTRRNKLKTDKGQFNKDFNSHRINHKATKMLSNPEALTEAVEAVAVNNVTNFKTDTKKELDPSPDREMTKIQTLNTLLNHVTDVAKPTMTNKTVGLKTRTA